MSYTIEQLDCAVNKAVQDERANAAQERAHLEDEISRLRGALIKIAQPNTYWLQRHMLPLDITEAKRIALDALNGNAIRQDGAHDDLLGMLIEVTDAYSAVRAQHPAPGSQETVRSILRRSRALIARSLMNADQPSGVE